MYKYDVEKYVNLVKELRNVMFEEISNIDKINPNHMNPETTQRNIMINNFYDLDCALEHTEKRFKHFKKEIDLENKTMEKSLPE